MVKGAVLQGIRAIPIDIEIGLAPGSGIRIIGLPPDAVRGLNDRLCCALESAGYQWPGQTLTINLTPAILQKWEAGLDLPLALSILLATGQIRTDLPQPLFAFGEVDPWGRVKGCGGALSVGRMVPEGAVLVAPRENELELGLLLSLKGAQKNYRPFVADSLAAAASILKQGRGRLAVTKAQDFKPAFPPGTDFKDIEGQTPAKRALEVAAAGGHNVLLIGPPDRTLRASALPTILPRLEPGEIIELTEIYSAKGLLKSGSDVVLHPPFRLVRPVDRNEHIDFIEPPEEDPNPELEILLAHRGVLFIDQLHLLGWPLGNALGLPLEDIVRNHVANAEWAWTYRGKVSFDRLHLFSRQLVNALGLPLEEGRNHVASVERPVTFPSEFILVAAMYPCPCLGLFSPCDCTPSSISRWWAQVPASVLDQFDLRIWFSVPTAEKRKNIVTLSAEETFAPGVGESSHEIRRRVEDARRMQKERFKGTTIKLNGRIPGGQVDQYCEPKSAARRALVEISKRVPELRTRGFDQLLKVARTVADLNNSVLIKKKHVAEAAELCGDEAVKGFFLTHFDVEQS